MTILETLTHEFSVAPHLVENIVKLIDEGNTIPFIARYRKEQTGSMDDQKLRELADRLLYLRNLEKRRGEISDTITEQEKMTDEIGAAIAAAVTLSELEDIYRPFKQKRRTRATVAKERGLEPLAMAILAGSDRSPEELAADYITEDVPTLADAIQGAMDIIAELVSDDAEVRKYLREYMLKHAIMQTKATKEKQEDSVYAMYNDYSEPVSKIQNHRILAINRGEKEDFLKVKVEVDSAATTAYMKRSYVPLGKATAEVVKAAIDDSYQRLIYPSLEREIRNILTQRASESAIKVFSTNLKQLLLQPPIKNKVCLAVDPAYRTGCKIAVCDRDGSVLEVGVIYPTPPQSKVEEAKKTLAAHVKKYGIDVIAIGNGTASKESEIFIADFIKDKPQLSYMMVNEAGASVYSASKLAAEEFPDFDVSLRSAVSISRRLQDPLSELVKIDPKAIGVGQYQHDMPPAELSASLTGVVEDCVNSVGVDVNTASPSLLSYISGLNATVSKNIVAYRRENGSFSTRKTLLKVAKLGPKAFEQCAGFLRIADGENILDNTGVHPESYKATEKLLKIWGYTMEDVKENRLSDLDSRMAATGKEKAAEFAGIGLPTLEDIVKELKKPGRDIRDDLPAPMLRKDIMDMKDLKAGMELTGTVRNVIDFGAFIDIAVHQDGLVHISEICDKFIKHPSEVLAVGDIVTVWVLSVDARRNRIALTMKQPK